RAEGLARELVSRVQRLRRDAGLAVSDRIALAVAGDPELEDVARQFAEHLATETLATRVLVGQDAAGAPWPAGGEAVAWTAMPEGDVDGRPLRLALTKESA
ncbi:MAG TPA: DUF5915 domain-containing protein, partial [Gemmatimonadaceae bacterium]|nr:DUF5915 domain-containing protein [Gemmatimonadaceae bacterium]